MAKKLFVGNLAFSTTSTELTELFREFGEVGDIFIPTDRGRNLRVNEAEERSRAPRVRSGFNDGGRGNSGQKRFKPKGSRKNLRARKRGF